MNERSSRKRKHSELDEEEEFEDVSSVKGPASHATVHGLLGNISMMKKGRYFDAQLSDDKTSMRVVGFHADARRKLLEHMGNTVKIIHCEIQYTRDTEELEIVINKPTVLQKSHRTFSGMQSPRPKPGKRPVSVTPLSKLDQLPPLEEVTIEVRVDHVEDRETILGGHKRQDILVRDDKGAVRVTLWGQNVGKLKEDRSYRLSRLMVERLQGETVLSTAKRTIKIEKILPVAEDIPEGKIHEKKPHPKHSDVKISPVKHPKRKSHENGSNRIKIKKEKRSPSPDQSTDDFTVVGVDQFERYAGCMKCGSEVTWTDQPNIGECTNCHMVQSMTECPALLKSMVIIKDGSGCKIPLVVYHQEILDIAQLPESVEITPMALLKAEKFSMDYDQGILKSITRNNDYA